MAFPEPCKTPAPFTLLAGAAEHNLDKLRLAICQQCGLDIGLLDDAFPCSPSQEGLFNSKTTIGAPYVRKSVFKQPHDLDIPRFKEAWRVVRARHDTMRTRIVLSREQKLLQAVFHEEMLWCEELSSTVAEFIRKEQFHPIALGAPTMRYTLLTETSTGDLYFVWSAHHVVFDARSLQEILFEVDGVYRGDSQQGCKQRLPFQSFIAHSQRIDPLPSRHFWRAMLAESPAPRFPLTRETTIDSTVANSMRTIRFDLPLRDKSGPLAAISRPSLLRTTWAVFLSIMESSDDVVFGTVVGNRKSLKGADTILGPMINTIPVRTRVSGEQTVAELAAAVQADSFASAPHEHLSALGISTLGEDAARACKLTNIFIIEGGADPGLNDAKGVLSHRSFDQDQDAWTDTLTYPLTLRCIMTGNSISLYIHYQSLLIDHEAAMATLRQFEYLATRICTEGHTRVKELRTASPADMAQTQAWNTSLASQIPGVTPLSIFQRAVAKHPDALAISSWDGSMTYHELDSASSRLALYLEEVYPYQRQAVSRWPLCFEKSRFMIISILAVLKAGCTYYCIDPTAAVGRQKAILYAFPAEYVLCGPSTEASIRDMSAKPVVVNEKILSDRNTAHAMSLPPPPGLEDVALILFTSGSTGTPKAIAHTQGSLASIITSLQKAFPLSEHSRILHFASYSYDMAQAEIWTSIANGSCLCIASETERLDQLSAVIRERQASFAYLTPTVLQMLRPKDVPSLSLVVTAGETPSSQIIEDWGTEGRLWSLYGPAEMIMSTTCRLEPGSDTRFVGTCDRHAVWITDPDDPNNLRPIGVVGEVLIQSPGLARGYLDNDRETSAKFLKDLSWMVNSSQDIANTQSRVYRTGDLGRLLHDGNLEFHGRIDTQVKIHGRRIEIGEIEHHAKHALAGSFELAVEYVKPPADQDTGNKIIAFVAVGSSVDAQAEPSFRDILATIERGVTEHLPTDLVPRQLILLETLPQTATGKVDRKALHRIAARGEAMIVERFTRETKVNGTGPPPASQKEEHVLTTCVEVLDLEASDLKMSDNFFMAGGNSVRAMQLAALLLSRHNLKLSVRAVFTSQTISDISKACVDQEAKELSRVPSPFELIEPRSLKERLTHDAAVECNVPRAKVLDMFPLTGVQEAELTGEAGFQMQQCVIRLYRSVDPDLLISAWRSAATLIPLIRTRYVQGHTRRRWQVVIRETFTCTTISSPIQKALLDDLSLPMDFGSPLARVSLVEERGGTKYLVFTTAKTLFDDASVALTLQVLEQAFQGGVDLRPQPYKVWVSRIMQKDEAAAESYWRRQLDQIPAIKPKDGPKAMPINGMTRSAIKNIPLTDLYQGADHLPLYLAGWGLLLAYHQGSHRGTKFQCFDEAFGLQIPGRSSDKTDMSGFMEYTVPFRIGGSSQTLSSELLAYCMTTLSDAKTYGHIGLQRLKGLSTSSYNACAWRSKVVVRNIDIHGQMNGSSIGTVEKLLAQDDERCRLVLELGPDGSGGHRAELRYDGSEMGSYEAERLLMSWGRIISALQKGPNEILGDVVASLY